MTSLSIVIPAKHEADNLGQLIPKIKEVVAQLGIEFEIIIVSDKSDHATNDAATAAGTKLVFQEKPGYGGALLEGFRTARGSHVLTMDADLSHSPDFIQVMWESRERADVIIASRYVPGGGATMPASRFFLSRVLNVMFSRGLSLNVRDMSSGFRLYSRSSLGKLAFQSRDFNILQEILISLIAQGYSILEVPFQYMPRQHGTSNARVFKFGLAYLQTFPKLWRRRNSIVSADYDFRAHDSIIPLQRYWQRMRHKHITELIAHQGPVLDVGCGSSKIIGALPPNSLALDVLLRKVLFARRFGKDVVNGSGFTLPVPDESFPCVLCSQVIEHVPMDSPILSELIRTLKKGGRLVLGTPDYANWEWVVTEKLYGFFAPGGYADEHISHYTREGLIRYFTERGFAHEATRYILRGELILAFKKL